MDWWLDQDPDKQELGPAVNVDDPTLDEVSEAIEGTCVVERHPLEDEAHNSIKFPGRLQPRKVGRGRRFTDRSVVALSATRRRPSDPNTVQNKDASLQVSSILRFLKNQTIKFPNLNCAQPGSDASDLARSKREKGTSMTVSPRTIQPDPDTAKRDGGELSPNLQTCGGLASDYRWRRYGPYCS